MPQTEAQCRKTGLVTKILDDAAGRAMLAFSDLGMPLYAASDLKRQTSLLPSSFSQTLPPINGNLPRLWHSPYHITVLSYIDFLATDLG